MQKEAIRLLYERGVISELDFQFGDFMMRLSGVDSPELMLAASLVSRYRSEGHVCLDISTLAGGAVPFGGQDLPACPELIPWMDALKRSKVVGAPGDYRPLILDGSRLYLYRYWEYEKDLVESLRERARGIRADVREDVLRDGIARLFPEEAPCGWDMQKTGALISVLKRFCVISGGPGTGKTSTVARILALLMEQAGGETLRICLAAPTGKAAQRLREAISDGRGRLNCHPDIKAALPAEASTIHRLLQSRPASPYFRHDRDHPLDADVIVVDEASMIDLPLMSKLVQALRPQAHLILLGDRDQLASVEAGAVLGDLCGAGRPHGYSPLLREAIHRVGGGEITGDSRGSDIGDCIVQLEKNYRFGPASGIGEVCRAVNAGDGVSALARLKEEGGGDIGWRDLPGPEVLARALGKRIVEGFSRYINASDPGEALDLFNGFRILCALREGPYGVSSANLLSEQVLRREGLIRKEGRWYPGRPVLITRNDYNLRLYNGDVGIVLPDKEAGHELRVYFPDAGGTVRRFPPLRIPEHETAFAMTVHKSQGSEFDNVILLLPDRDVPVLTRELIYTGISRAKNRVEVWGKREIFNSAVARRIERASGLRESLWG